MKRIDYNLRGAISMNDFIMYFDPKIKKFSLKKEIIEPWLKRPLWKG